MYCPNCGRQATESQRYCTSCGVNLAVVTQALSGHLVTPAGDREIRRRTDEIRQGIQTMCVGIGLAIFLFMFMRLMGLGIGVLVFLVGLGKVAGATVFASSHRSFELRWPAPSESQSNQPALPDMRSTGRLDGPPPSVTENTTLRLEQPPPTPSKEKQ